jgi:hypothetical protein
MTLLLLLMHLLRPEPLFGSLLLMGAGPGNGVHVPVAEVTTFDFSALDAADFVTGAAGKYLLLSVVNDPARYAGWFRVDDQETEPVVAGATAYAVVFDGVAVGGVVTITQEDEGPVLDAEEGTTEVTVTVTVQGA